MSNNTNKTELEAKLAELEAKLAESEAKNAESEAKLAESEAKNAESEAKLAESEAKNAESEAKLAESEAELAKAMETAETVKSQTSVKSETTPEKMVQIKIPLTREETGDVFVSVNDRQWLIKRGEYVEVPECVAEVFRHQENALRHAIEFIAANEQKLPQ